jgi:hypothetical protein
VALAGGYYTIEQKVRRLRLVMLNTNLCSDFVDNEDDPAGQWAWLDDTLQKSQRNRETVSPSHAQNSAQMNISQYVASENNKK